MASDAARVEPDTTAESDEKRIFARVSVRWPVRVQCLAGTLEGRLTDLSMGGAAIQLDDDARPQPDEHVTIEFALPDREQTMRLASVVTRITDAEVGIQFDERPPPSLALVLRRLVSHERE